jgi:hypothetical protein
MTTKELLRMAERGAEDGHDDDWHTMMTTSERIRAMMKEAAQKARDRLKKIEKNFVPKP